MAGQAVSSKWTGGFQSRESEMAGKRDFMKILRQTRFARLYDRQDRSREIREAEAMIVTWTGKFAIEITLGIINIYGPISRFSFSGSDCV